MAIVDELIRAVLQGESAFWTNSSNSKDELCFLDFTLQHGIQPLLYYNLRQSKYLENWPDRIRHSLENEAKRQIVIDTIRQQNLQEVLKALSDRKIIPLLIKGTALAYTHYADSSLRPRCDTDLLIQKKDLHALEIILRDFGYTRFHSVSGSFIRHQFLYVKQGEHGIGCDLDVHWKISNPNLFADMITFDELQLKAIGIPQLSQYALTLCPVDSLLLACLHRVAHHHGKERLIWLYDIHLLAAKMKPNELEEFWEKAAQKKLMAICSSGLTAARFWFNTQWPEHKIQQDQFEPSAQYLQSNLERIDLLLMNLRHLSGWHKIQLLREHLFPPASYMLQRYGVSQHLLLPALYLHRSITGTWNWLRKPHQKRL